MQRKSVEDKKRNALTKDQAIKYNRSLELNAGRQRRFKANMSDEMLEKKRQRDREQYYKLKEDKKIKTINEMTDRQKASARKEWKKRKQLIDRRRKKRSQMHHLKKMKERKNKQFLKIRSQDRKNLVQKH